MAAENVNNLPPVQAQLIINYHGGNTVSFNVPTNMKLVGFMIGQLLQNVLNNCEFKEPSPIIKVPMGAKLVG